MVYPTDYMSLINNKVQLDVIDKFVKDLEISLGVKHEKVSFETLWKENPPKEAGQRSLQDYMKDVCYDYRIIDGLPVQLTSPRLVETLSFMTIIIASTNSGRTTLRNSTKNHTSALQSAGNGTIP